MTNGFSEVLRASNVEILPVRIKQTMSSMSVKGSRYWFSGTKIRGWFGRLITVTAATKRLLKALRINSEEILSVENT